MYLLDWRKSIKDYLDKVEKYKYHKIVLSESAFTLITDTDETIERWSEFKKVEINELSITLWGNESYLIPSYLIPKKSMDPKDYEFFEKEISEKMNNNLA